MTQKMKSLNNEAEEIYQSIVTKCKSQVETMIERIASAKSKVVLQQYSVELNFYVENLQHKMDEVLKNELEKIEEKTIIIKESQLAFFKNIS